MRGSPAEYRFATFDGDVGSDTDSGDGDVAETFDRVEPSVLEWSRRLPRHKKNCDARGTRVGDGVLMRTLGGELVNTRTGLPAEEYQSDISNALGEAQGAVWQTERCGTAVLIHDGCNGERVLYFATLAAAIADHDSNDVASADIGTTVRLRPSATMRWSDAFEATVVARDTAACPMQLPHSEKLRLLCVMVQRERLAHLPPQLAPLVLHCGGGDRQLQIAPCWMIGFPVAPSETAVRDAYGVAGSATCAFSADDETRAFSEFVSLLRDLYCDFRDVPVVCCGDVVESVALGAHTANSICGMIGGAVLVRRLTDNVLVLVGLNAGASIAGGRDGTNVFVPLEYRA